MSLFFFLPVSNATTSGHEYVIANHWAQWPSFFFGGYIRVATQAHCSIEQHTCQYWIGCIVSSEQTDKISQTLAWQCEMCIHIPCACMGFHCVRRLPPTKTCMINYSKTLNCPSDGMWVWKSPGIVSSTNRNWNEEKALEKMDGSTDTEILTCSNLIAK